MAAIALAAVAVLPAMAQRPAPARTAQTDWTRTVARTPEGGFRMGNPDAPVKLVEYLSLTCGHCATFAADGSAGLREHVRAGRVNVEYRNYVLNIYDLAAAVLSRCAAPRDYFALTEALLAQQADWTARGEALTPEQRAQINVRPTPASIARTTELLGLTGIAARHGVSPARARTCLADPANLRQVVGMVAAAERLGVDSTPTFLLNGRLLGPQNWASLQPLLASAP